ncbi:MAG: hypothetical protein PWP49_1097 [Thermococcaceae archaeon]|nr:hypothetical protein [Thermococcaceae archaeon]
MKSTQDKTIRVSKDAYLLLEKTKNKLKTEYQTPYSYSDIILSAIPVFEIFLEEDREAAKKLLDAAKESRLKKRRGEIPDYADVITEIAATAKDIKRKL